MSDPNVQAAIQAADATPRPVTAWVHPRHQQEAPADPPAVTDVEPIPHVVPPTDKPSPVSPDKDKPDPVGMNHQERTWWDASQVADWLVAGGSGRPMLGSDVVPAYRGY